MSRPASVTVVAILALLGSVLTLLMAALTGLSMQLILSRTVEQPPLAHYSMILTTVLFAGLGVWGIATAIGLLRLKAWARTSTLVFSAGLVFLALCSALFLFVLPVPVPPAQNAALFRGVMMGMAVFYGLLALVGIWWLVLFNRPAIKAAFSGGRGFAAESPLPLSIRLIAWLLLSTAPLFPFAIWLDWPTTFLGVFIRDWPAKLAYSGFAVWSAAAGYGLLKRKTWAYRLTLAFFGFGLVNTVLFCALPGQQQKIVEWSRTLLPPGMDPDLIQPLPPWIGLLFGLLGTGLPLYLVLTRKNRYLAACKAPSPVATPHAQG